MNLKKMLVSVISIFILVVFIGLQGMVFASTEGQEIIYMGILPLMVNNEPNMGYSINKPGDDNAAKIWRIVKYVSSDGAQIDTNYNNIYCVKAGVGFTDTDSSGGLERRPYNVSYDMKTERTQIKAQNEILKALVEGTITLEDGTTINRYDAMLATMDMMYLPGESEETQKTELINEIINFAKQSDSGYTAYVGLIQQYPLTEDDIVAVQQAALWYFTNYEEAKYDKTDDIGWLNYTLDGTDYEALSNYTPNDLQPQQDAGQARSYQAEILYNYIIREAKANASKYTNSSSEIVKPVKINTTTLAYTESEDKQNYIVGPINITENIATIPYTIDFNVKNNGADISYTLLNSDKTEATGKTVKELVGSDFYISIPKTEELSLTVDINVNYNNTIMTLWASTTNNQEQPLVILEKDPETEPTILTLNLNEPEKIFDLALRKYITKINGKELTELGLGTRVPSIEEATIKSDTTTATYKHRKDPITIATGDKVTYKLTIYNEGEKAGRATKIVDQLPTGLKYTQVLSGNFELDSYNEETNTLNLKRKSTNTDNLPAYAEGNLASETIEIECEVTATPDSKLTKVLTNVAWISEEYDAEDDVIIEDVEGLDIDSEPGTTPDVDKDSMSNYAGNGNKTDLSDSDYYYKGEQDDDDFEKLVLLPEAFDLKLIKRITAVNDQPVPERIESIDVSKLNVVDSNGNINTTTADYELNKEPVPVKKGDIVTYTFRIYNEGTIDGYAQEITEDVPEGLKFLWSEKEGEELQADTTFTDEEKAAIEFNQQYLWGSFVYDEAKENIIQISSDYLSKENETTVEGNLIKAFGKNDGSKTESDLSYKEISVKFKVVSENVAGTIIRNEAAITEDCDKNKQPVDDRDSKPEDWKKYEDDEDYDNIVLQSFDIALRKFIIAVSADTEIENSEYLKNEDGSYTRAPVVDTSKLETLDEDGKLITTAIYNHTKEPVEVQKNDYVVYMLRVYNEGNMDGFAAEIKDHLPPYLEFVDGEFNEEYGWEVSEDGRTVTTRYLASDEYLIKAATNEDGEIVISYKEVPIMCRVKDTAKTSEEITNIADITKYEDEEHEAVEDRDSQPDNVTLPDDENLPEYKDDETGDYVPGQQDDDDFEKVIIKKFDLALRKFITKVNEEDVTTRIPEVKYENGKISYEHTKDPVDVITNDIVIYTIRVYNEGEIDGYASEITDDLPEGLEFLPDNERNKTYRWVMYDKDGNETDDVTKADKVTTDYLSKEQEGEDGLGNLLQAFNPDEPISDALPANPDYRDVKIAFKVVEPNGSSKILVNAAQISEDTDAEGDPVDDEDSITDEWNDGEDDQDNEYLKLSNFDLALRKWVTEAIVIENGKETVTPTGHKPYDDPEGIVKVELHRKKLDQVTVKFRYSIRVINEGDIEGYVKEVTDYVPQGLKFVAEDNPGWTDEGNNVISTRLLENTLLKPGEYADVEVVLTWINSQDNMGVMENVAEISEDYNEKGIPDKDSTPDNKKDGEDDIDDAPVMLSISTGQVRIYFTLGFIILATIAGGVILIKKFVL